MARNTSPIPSSEAAAAPATRRERREAERRSRRRLAAGALGIPGGVVKAARAGVLGAVVIGMGAFTVIQTSAQTGIETPADLAAVGGGALDLRAAAQGAGTALVDTVALEADAGAAFTVEVDSESVDLETAADTLAEALAEAGIVVGADDVVTAPLGGPVPGGQTVQIHRAANDLVTEEVVEECEPVEEEDPELPEGEEEVEEEGRDGVTTTTYRILTAGEEELSRQRLSTVTTECIPEVVRVGTQVEETGDVQAGSGGEDGGSVPAPTGPVDPGSNRAIGQDMAAARGWAGDQWSCLDNLWQRESGWNHLAANPSSSAYGIPQSLPGSKMASHGDDWQTNPATQIAWGLDYIGGRYGSPCGAWAHFQANNWY